MKLVFIKIMNLFPYLLLISIYFFFINIEARNNKIIKKVKEPKEVTSDINNIKQRITIPVYPFNQ